jgi:hypothetical protein
MLPERALSVLIEELKTSDAAGIAMLLSAET